MYRQELSYIISLRIYPGGEGGEGDANQLVIEYSVHILLYEYTRPQAKYISYQSKIVTKKIYLFNASVRFYNHI